MVIYKCDNIDDENVVEAARMHIEHLSYRSFITDFGLKFIIELYKDWLKDNNAILLLATNEGELSGFVLGLKNNQRLFVPIKRNPMKYFKIIFLCILKRPYILKKIFETLFYTSKAHVESTSELLVIVTNSKNREKGLGTQLVNSLNSEFKKENILNYTVTVHKKMDRSNNFYIKNNMNLEKSFDMYGSKWNLYLNKII